MTSPNPTHFWILLGLPLGLVLAGFGLFLTRWLQLRPRSGGDP